MLRRSSHCSSLLTRTAAWAIIGLSSLNPTAWALEGGTTSEDRRWSAKIVNEAVSPEDRQQEQTARKAAIAADIKRLQARLKTTPSADLTKQLHDKLKKIIAQKGLVKDQGMVYGIRDIQPILDGQDTLKGTMLECLVQFKNDMAKRDIDVIFIPIPPTPFVYAHDLVDGIEANHDYTPGWTKMLLTMLEHDLEIIDPIEAFRAHSKDELVIKWPNDFHTADGGRLIAAKMLAERLQRYGFVRNLKSFIDSYQLEEVQSKIKKTRIADVNGQGKGEDRGFKSVLKDRTFTYLNVTRAKGSPDNRRSDLVMIGDSQNHSAVYGSGWPAIAMSQIGGTFRWGSRSGGISHSLNPIYLSVVPDFAVQPRVIVVTSLTKYFWKPIERKPQRLPDIGETNAQGIPTQRFDCTVEFLKISKPPSDDATKLDYKSALFHAAVKVIDGPLAGKEIGIRYRALYKSRWAKAKSIHAVGKTMKLRLISWDIFTKSNSGRSRSQWPLYDDTNQDLLIPVFWVDNGELVGGKI